MIFDAAFLRRKVSRRFAFGDVEFPDRASAYERRSWGVGGGGGEEGQIDGHLCLTKPFLNNGGKKKKESHVYPSPPPFLGSYDHAESLKSLYVGSQLHDVLLLFVDAPCL